jgi:fatty-acyl-CoA synthase
MFCGDWLHRRELLSPNKLALIDAESGDLEITYRQWNCRVNRMVNSFQQKLGIEEGDRISIYSVNRMEYLEVMFACNELRPKLNSVEKYLSLDVWGTACVYWGLYESRPDETEGIDG